MPSFLNTKRPAAITAKLCAASLAACLLLTGCQTSGVSGSYQPRQDQVPAQRRTVAFSEMEMGEADGPQLVQEIKDLTARLGSIETLEELLEEEAKLNEHSERFSTSSTLADLATYLDTTDTAARELSETFSVQGEEVSNVWMEYLRAVLKSPLGEAYRKDAGEYISKEMDRALAVNDPAALEPMQRRAELNNQYNDKYSNLRATVNGKQYRLEELGEALDSGEVDITGYSDGVLGYFFDNYEEFGALYLEMIRLDKEAAAACGYSDAAAWNYQRYSRDYTPEDARNLIKQVKKYLVPLTAEIEAESLSGTSVEEAAGLAAVEKVLCAADPALERGWNFLKQYGLTSFSSGGNKMAGIGFTTSLARYDAPFVYTYWGGSLSDAFTVVHEFGHAMDEYSQFGYEAYAQDLDKCEVFSQALEMVLMDEVAAELGADQQTVRDAKLGDLLETLVYQSLLEEFQLEAYALGDDATPLDLCALYGRLLEEYGYQPLLGEGYADPSWFVVTHFFDAPFYTISYVTSATAALELGRIEVEEGKGLESWLGMLKVDRNQSFEGFLNAAGIASPFEAGRIRECARFLSGQLTGQTSGKAA